MGQVSADGQGKQKVKHREQQILDPFPPRDAQDFLPGKKGRQRADELGDMEGNVLQRIPGHTGSKQGRGF